MLQKVTTTDDMLQVYQDRDVSSRVIVQARRGAEIHLGAATVHEGREWMEAIIEDNVGYVLGPSARGHTTLGPTVTVVPSEIVQLAEALRPPLPAPQPNKIEVPVAVGILLGVVLLGLRFVLQEDLRQAPIAEFFGKAMLIYGATLIGGGLFVFLAEIVEEHMPPRAQNTDQGDLGKRRTPKWAYVLAGLCCVGCMLGGLLGLNFAGFSGRFSAGAIVGAICGPCSVFPASACVLISRNLAVSVPRRIYGCILIAGFSCLLAIGITYKFSSAFTV